MNQQLSREDMIRAARAASTSQKQMAELCGISDVSYWLNKYNLPKFGKWHKWAPEDIEAIKADFQRGESLADIATTRNATRNQIAGVLGRAGMFKKNSERTHKPRPPKIHRRGNFKIAGIVQEPKFKKVRFKPRAVSVIPLHIAFLDLQPTDCRQAYGDDPRTMTFCGHDVLPGKPYCPHHAAINYRAPEERNRSPRPRT